MKKPFVTIVSGFYNREKYVKESLLSLKQQDYENFEAIIFDDCSTDNTFEEINKIVGDDNRFILIRHEKNLGFVQGLINAIDTARGEYIAIHGSGDISRTNRISKQVEVLENEKEVQVVGCYFLNVDRCNNITRTVKRKGQYEHADLFHMNPLSHGEAMYRKEEYKNIGGYRSIFKYAQDLDLWLRLSRNGVIKIIPEILYERIINYEGVSYSVDKMIEQKKYAYLAKSLVKKMENDQNNLIEQVRKNGIDDVVNIYEKKIQHSIFKMHNVLFVKNKITTYEIIIKQSSYPYKLYYHFMKMIYNNKMAHRFINYIYKNFT